MLFPIGGGGGVAERTEWQKGGAMFAMTQEQTLQLLKMTAHLFLPFFIYIYISPLVMRHKQTTNTSFIFFLGDIFSLGRTACFYHEMYAVH